MTDEAAVIDDGSYEAMIASGMTPEQIAEYEAWATREDARGELAGTPEFMDCYECGGFDGETKVSQRVVALGPIAEAHRDPTQTYKLACGHTVI